MPEMIPAGTLNHWVEGSSPSGVTTVKRLLMSDKLLKEKIMNTPIMNQSTRNLDIEFAQNMRILSKAASTNHPVVKLCISHCIEMYIHEKLDAELTHSFQKVFKINNIQ